MSYTTYTTQSYVLCSTPSGLASELFCHPELCSGLFTVNPFRVATFRSNWCIMPSLSLRQVSVEKRSFMAQRS